SNGGNILLDQGSRLWANTGDININALNGSITANSLQVGTLGKVSLLASKNVILAANKVETAVTGTDAKNITYTPSKISADKGIQIASIDNGYLRLNTINLDAKNGDIQLDAKGNISLVRSDVITQHQNADGSFSPKTTYLWSELKGKNILINSGANNSLNWGNLNATGNIQAQAKGTQFLYGMNLKSGANTTLHADGRQTLHHVTAQSAGHTALSTKDRLHLSSSIVAADGTTNWGVGNTVKLQADGVLSLVSGAGQYLQNTDLKGGAVLIESGAGFDVNKNVKVTATGSPLLNNDKDLKKLNGNLSIQTNDNLTIDPKLLTLSAVGDYDLMSKKGDLTLIGHGGTKGNGSEQVVKLNTTNGGINLAGQKVELQGTQLNAAKDISIVSTGGDLIVDGLKNTLTNQRSTKQLDALNASKTALQNELKTLVEEKSYIDEEKRLRTKLQDETNQFDWECLEMNRSCNYYGELVEEASHAYNLFMQPERNLINQLNEAQSQISFFDKNVNGYEHLGATLTSNTGNINLASKQGLSISGADIDAKKGSVLIEASGTLSNEEYQIQGEFKSNIKNSVKQGKIKGSIIIDATQDSYEIGQVTNDNYNWRSPVNATTINGDKGVKIKATGKSATDNLILQGVGITSNNGNVDIEAYKNIIFDVAVENGYDKSKKTETKRKWYGKKKTITTIKTAERVGGLSVDIDAKNINIKSGEAKKADDKETGQHRTSIDMYSSQLTAHGGKVKILAGGDINLLTADNVSKDTLDISKSSSWAGIKLNKSKYTSTRNIKSELPAVLEASYIGAQADGSIILKGTEFNYLEGAEIKAGEKITLLGASELVEATKTKTSNSVVWQSMQDKGSINETAQLPTFNGPVAPKFVGSLTVQVPVTKRTANQKELIAEIENLAKTPGNAYLKSLVDNKDQKVNWEQILLTNEDWDYKSQGLTAAGAAILAIAIAAATGGAGVGAILSTGGTVTNAALLSLTTQASISLINNGGDLSATFKELGSKDSVKSLAITVVTAGLVEGLSTSLKIDLNGFPTVEKIANNFVQGVGSNLISSTLQGESLSDSLEKALLAGLSSSIQGELASKIKGLEDVDYILHKIAHAAAGCVAGALQKSCEAGAIGAVVGEMAADLVPRSKELKDMTPQERDAYNKKVVATAQLLAGTVSAYSGYDVNTAANSAAVAVTNNYLTSKEVNELKAELDKCTDNQCKTNAFMKYKVVSDANDAALRAACSGLGLNSNACTGHINALLEGLSQAQNVKLKSQYMAFNNLGKFDNTVQWKSEAIKATNIFTTWANANCGNGVSEAVCKSRYDALDVKRKEELQNALDVIAWMPVAGNAISVADSFKVLLTGTGIAGLEQNRLLAAANIVSAGFGNRVTRVQGINTTVKNVSKTTTAMARGRAFEKSLIEALGAIKNNQLATVKLPDGTVVRTIPDLWGKSSGGIVEVKDVMNLSLSKQLQAQIKLAGDTGQPFNLVISERNQYISEPLRKAIERNNGKVYVFDSSHKTLTELSL
ncbi:DUF637 domain-containing protein, partial [Acinetobacter sp. NIPH 298]|uniref:DUF637 domain-containing protein n=1 Tax=Acinetobacter sp. NIPH 298 TaxID=1217692 RepID=UPI0002CDB95D